LCFRLGRPARQALDSTDQLRAAAPTIRVWALGHESLATTQKYLEPSKETEKQLEAPGVQPPT
jgi:hypothetical protein